jgi:osmotically-inducible protein OsmY
MADRYSERDRWGGGRYGEDERRREWERGGGQDYDRRRWRGEREAGGEDDRGFFDRASDEVRTWFGDEEAQRRRKADERKDERRYGGPRRHDYGGSGWGQGPERGFAEGERRGGRGHERRGSERYGEQYGSERRREERGWGPAAGGGYGTQGYGGTRSAGQGGAYYGQEYGEGGLRERGGGWEERSGAGMYGGGFGQETGYGRERRWAEESGGMRGPYAGHGPKGYQRSDERIREDVCERLSLHGYLDASDIEVTVSGAEVTLQGSVGARRDKRLAEDLAESVSGVKEVHNHVRVAQAQTSTPDQPPRQAQQRTRAA